MNKDGKITIWILFIGIILITILTAINIFHNIDLNKQVNEQRAILIESERQLNATGETLALTQNDLSALKQDNEDMRTNYSDSENALTSEIAQLKADLLTANNDNKVLQKSLAMAEENNTVLQQAVTTAKEETTTATQTLDLTKTNFESLKKKYAVLSTELTSLASEDEVLNSSLEDAKTKLNELQSLLDSMNTEQVAPAK